MLVCGTVCVVLELQRDAHEAALSHSKARRKLSQPIGKQSLNIRDTPPSNLGSDTNYPEGFHGGFQSFQANAVILS